MMRRRDLLMGAALARPGFAVSTFRTDITPPIGGPLFTGPARSIVDRLDARGLVLHGPGRPVVAVSLDWCEVRNQSYDLWRDELARAAGTTRERVLVSCVHPHDAPYTDAHAQSLIRAAGMSEPLCDPEFEKQTVARVAQDLRAATPVEVTHIGTGQARVAEVASNRRYVLPDGRVSFGRTSATRDPAIRAMPEGLIDPWLKALSFWNGAKAVAAMSVYSTHPMSYYGKGDVTGDFPCLARNQMQEVFHIYCSGASGDTMAGRYNDGDPANRAVLAGRMQRAMREAFQSSERTPVGRLQFRNAALRLAPRTSPGFARHEMETMLANPKETFRNRWNAALGLSWLDRLRRRQPIDVPAVDFGGGIKLVLVPAEAFVQYQLWAQEHGRFVVTLGYGECAPGYIPTLKEVNEGYNDHYCWADMRTSESAMRSAIRKALG